MRTALCLGGGSTLDDDLERFAALGIEHHGVVLCNDAGYHWPGEVDAWVSLHPNKLNQWAQRRRALGFPEARRMYGHIDKKAKADSCVHERVEYRFPNQSGSGSSGLFTAKVALIDLGFDRAVFCGVPLTETPHFFAKPMWKDAGLFRKAWMSLDDKWKDRMRSMSGWTHVLLGGPEDWQ